MERKRKGRKGRGEKREKQRMPRGWCSDVQFFVVSETSLGGREVVASLEFKGIWA